MPSRRPLALCASDDLMLQVRVQAAASEAGMDFASAGTVLDLQAQLVQRVPDVVVLDLSARGLPWREALVALGPHDQRPRVLAFFPHVMADLGTAARDAGIDLVVPRSRFMADTAGLLRQVSGPVSNSKGAAHE